MFNPNFITKLITTALIIPMGFGAVEPAKAAECVYGEGYQMCFDSLGNNRRNVAVRNNYGSEFMTVQCSGKAVYDWRSRGDFSQSDASWMAKYFCSL